MSKNNALIIEDTPANRDFFDRLIQQAGFETYPAARGDEALKIADSLDSLGLAIIDMQMPDISGLDLTYRLREKFPDACLIVATMHDERSLMESAFNKGCNIFMVKPHGFIDLFKVLSSQGIESLVKQSPLTIDQHGLRPFVFTTTSHS